MSKPPESGPSSPHVSPFYNLKQTAWWRQQLVILSTESMLGLLAAVALIKGKGVVEISLAFAMLSLVSAFVLRFWHASYLSAIASAVVVLFILWLFGPAHNATDPWWGWMLAAGILMGARDVNAIHVMAQLNQRYRRDSINPFTQQKWNMMWSMVLFVTAMTLSGVLLNKNPQWANGLVLLGLIVCVGPMLFEHHERHWWRPVSPLRWKAVYAGLMEYRARRKDQGEFFSERASEHAWGQARLLRLSNWYHPVQIVGKRLLLPVMLVLTAKQLGWSQYSVGLIGTLFGAAGLIALLKTRSSNPFDAMLTGVRRSLIGWGLVAVGFAGITWHSPWWLVVGILGWIIMEAHVRAWGAGLIETLREWSGPRPHHRYYRRVLQLFFIQKSLFQGLFFLLMALAWWIGPLWMLALFGLAIAGAWVRTRKTLALASVSN